MDRDKKLMEEFMNNSFDFKKINKGNIVRGEIISSSKDEVIVNINYFCDGIIKKEELLNDIISEETYKKGNEIYVYVISLDDGEGNVLLSEKKANEKRVLEELKKLYESKEKVCVFVKESLEAGLEVYFKGVRGFIPRSRVSINKVDLKDYVGKTLEVYVIEFNPSKNKIVFSRKEIEIQKAKEEKERLINGINAGDKFLGVVKSVKDFGVFVDIGGVQGLVHKSEITHKRNFNIDEMFKVSDKVEVFVLNCDKETGKLSLTMKDSNYNPFEEYKNEFIEGNIYDVTISKILSSGIIVSLNDELTGFIHISEFPEEVQNLNKEFKVGDKIKGKILLINSQDGKISLSYKKVFEDDIEEFEYKEEEVSNTLGDVFKDLFSKLK